MQEDLFGAPPIPASAARVAARKTPTTGVMPAPASEDLLRLATHMPSGLRMGVSTWSYPGWKGLVWDGDYDASVLSRKGLVALSAHPLMRTVCVDRTFWRPLGAESYAQMAAQVPEDFRFMVKCPNLITDVMVRDEHGMGHVHNPAFMDPELAIHQFVLPCLQGLGDKLGVLVFQLSPMSGEALRHRAQVLNKLSKVLAATRDCLQHTPQVIVAVEVRDPELLADDLVHSLRSTGATFCMGLHGKMPPIARQIDFLKKFWPSPLVCRWNLNHCFGPYGYPQAQEKHQPFSEIRSPDPHTRQELARVITGITGRGYPAFVTISNDAEGCAPRSIALLAQSIREHQQA